MNFNYKKLSDEAYLYHQENKLEKAEFLYKKLLSVNPDDVNILNLLGLLYLAKLNTKEAINYLSQAYIIKKTAYIASNLAKAYYYNSEYEKAIKIYNQSLNLEESDDTYYSIALAYKKLNDNENAIINYKKAIELNPNNYPAMYNLSIIYKNIDNIDEAIFYANKCVDVVNNDEDIFSLLSAFYEYKGDYNSAITALQRAILLNNKNNLYFYNLGVLLSKVERFAEAKSAYEKSIELNFKHIESYINIASLYKDSDNKKALYYLEEGYKINPDDEKLCLSLAQTYRALYKNSKSIEILNKIIKNNPKSADAYSQLAMNYMDFCEYDIAYKNYELALSLDNKNINYLHGKAIALKYLGQTKEATQLLEDLVANYDVSIQTKTTLGMMYLANKEFEKGMELYSLRSKESKFAGLFKDKIWQKGVCLENKDILLFSDCGLGDTIMYSRFLPQLKNICKSITLQTDKELVSILQNSFTDITVVGKTKKVSKYDVVMPLMDLQYALNISFDELENVKQYLDVDNELVKSFSSLDIFKTKNKKVGLCWQGNKRIFKNRSIPFDNIEKLLENKEYSFYSFQLDEKITECDNFISLKPFIKDYKDTAALLKNIDLMITIDSSIAHMAGALGIKTYLLLPKTAEWRWFDDTDKTVWYDSVRIFRQTEANNWHDVIDRVVESL